MGLSFTGKTVISLLSSKTPSPLPQEKSESVKNKRELVKTSPSFFNYRIFSLKIAVRIRKWALFPLQPEKGWEVTIFKGIRKGTDECYVLPSSILLKPYRRIAMLQM